MSLHCLPIRVERKRKKQLKILPCPRTLSRITRVPVSHSSLPVSHSSQPLRLPRISCNICSQHFAASLSLFAKVDFLESPPAASGTTARGVPTTKRRATREAFETLYIQELEVGLKDVVRPSEFRLPCVFFLKNGDCAMTAFETYKALHEEVAVDVVVESCQQRLLVFGQTLLLKYAGSGRDEFIVKASSMVFAETIAPPPRSRAVARKTLPLSNFIATAMHDAATLDIVAVPRHSNSPFLIWENSVDPNAAFHLDHKTMWKALLQLDSLQRRERYVDFAAHD